MNIITAITGKKKKKKISTFFFLFFFKVGNDFWIYGSQVNASFGKIEFGVWTKLISLRANDLNRISLDSARAAAAQILFWE